MTSGLHILHARVDIVAPTCAVCNKPVEWISVQRDDFFRQFHVIVKCHGEIEECDIPETMLMAATALEPGVAFTRSRRLTKRS